MRTRPSAAVLGCLAALACTDGAGLDPSALVSITIRPSATVIPPGGTAQMYATVRRGDGSIALDVSLAWSSSDPRVATVDDLGRVDALSVGTATIRAAVDELSAEVALTVGVVCEETPRWILLDPVVIDPSATSDATLTAVFESCAPTVRLERPGGVSAPFQVMDDTTAVLTVPVRELMALHEPGDHHVFAGYVDLSNHAGRYFRGNGFLNVRLPSMPDVMPTSLADDAQRTTHVLNLLGEKPLQSGYWGDNAYVRRFYELMGDDYEVLVRVNAATVFANRSFEHVRNEVEGIGLGVIDAGEIYGSAATLEGVVNFPNASFFDLASPGLLHELGHRWINFSLLPTLAQGAPHWPLSDLADGIMGFNIPGSGGVGGSLSGPLVPAEGTDLRIDCSRERDFMFRDLELYLMGLLPPDEVAPHVIFQRQDQSLSCNAVWSGPTAVVTVEDVIAAQGERTPVYGEAPTGFRIGTIVVSLGRLLTADEMAYFDHMTARGAATEPLFYSSGFVSGITNPFHLATGGRATLDVVLR